MIHFIKNEQQVKAVNACLQQSRFILLLVRKGEVQLKMNTDMILVQARELLILPEDKSCTIKGLGNRSHIGILSFTRAFAFGNATRNLQPVFFMFLMAGKPFRIQLRPKDMSWLFLLFILLRVKNNTAEIPGTDGEVLQLGFDILLWELRRLYRYYSPGITVTYTIKHALVLHFLDMLNTHYKSQHQIQFYANALHLTADYLSKTIKQVTGKTAKQFVKDSILREAKVLLQEHLSIQGISRMLGFNSTQDFSKFFKTHTSLSPTAYRKKLSPQNSK
ncbi:AraC family transcriptional regulator [Sinomicrobium pectinilyticum]|uniref:AraC family transcriptional regulator n=1 Tax=Sinomicrobium pectinilyticum TaxID=1084421 RepID=A0A3N0EKP0_SINP1|nr:helix-turn-helix domain-containing protein [Sinomicrobium pectinilyticum]RNL88480.1 AraC family transcriptional regulator [Sinomicrobium pectinilyticum]